MTIRKITVNGNEYLFVNHHYYSEGELEDITTLYINLAEIGKARIYHVGKIKGRLPEDYAYQMVMEKCISRLIELEKNNEDDSDNIVSITELQEVYKQIESGKVLSSHRGEYLGYL